MKTRRDILQGSAALASLGLTGCADRDLSPPPRPRPDQPGTGRVLSHPGKPRLVHLSGWFQDHPFTQETPFRIASISKLLVAELARRLNAAGRLDLDPDAGDVMAFSLRHPGFPKEVVTLRRLLSHQSGIIDPAVYWMAAPGNIRTLLTEEIWEAGAKPGSGFRYSNLNYGIAATVIEAATGQRFDRLFAQYVAAPLGLDIGFNWSGVSDGKRALGFPAMRGAEGDWNVQIDGLETLNSREPAILREPGFDLEDYEIGSNGTLFSPQGGLRASLSDLMVIGREVVLAQPDLWTPVWRAEDTDARGAESEIIDGRGSEDGHFVAFGDGVYIYPDGPLPIPSRKWIGHHGEAYGVYCGLWTVPETGSVFAHADLGSPPDGSPLTVARPNNTVLATQAFEWAYRALGDEL